MLLCRKVHEGSSRLYASCGLEPLELALATFRGDALDILVLAEAADEVAAAPWNERCPLLGNAFAHQRWPRPRAVKNGSYDTPGVMDNVLELQGVNQ